VLVAGGYNYYGGGYLESAELYHVGLGFSSDWQPKIQRLKLTGGKRLLLKGSLFQGISQASGGNTQDSSSNYPIVQLRSIDNSEVAFLPVDPIEGWSDTSFTSLPVKHFPLGPALVTVFTNGIPSTAKYLVIPKHHD
jgi:large repetitive protein